VRTLEHQLPESIRRETETFALLRTPIFSMTRWYAIRTTARWEVLASDELSRRRIETYLPLCRVKHRWSDRIKIIEQPLFSGYLFGRFRLADRIRVLETPGVRQIVGIGAAPAPIAANEIDNLRTLVGALRIVVSVDLLQRSVAAQIDRDCIGSVE
jgi:transcription antitermination factor NusG